MIWKTAHLPKELRKVKAQRDQKVCIKVSRNAPRAIVTIDCSWNKIISRKKEKGKVLFTRSIAGRLPKRSARIAMTIEPIQEPKTKSKLNKKIKIKSKNQNQDQNQIKKSKSR